MIDSLSGQPEPRAPEIPQEAVEAIAKVWMFHVQTWAEQRALARGALKSALPAFLAAGWLPPNGETT